MENPGIDIETVELVDNTIKVTYANGAVETLPNDINTYKAFNDAWLEENPPFISDIYKVNMRNIILSAKNGDPRCIIELQQFFTSNPESVKKFLTYMRTRLDTLAEKKAIWHIIS